MRICGITSKENLTIAACSAICALMTAGIYVQERRIENAMQEIQEKDSARYERLNNVIHMKFNQKYRMWTNELKQMRDSIAVENYSKIK